MNGKKSFILTATEIIYNITKIVGLRPYKLPLGKSKKASFTLIIFLCIFISFTVFVSTIPILDPSKDNDIFNITYQHTILGSIVFVVIYTVYCVIKFRKEEHCHLKILKQELEVQFLSRFS